MHGEGVDVEAALNEKGWTALTFAARHGHFDVLKQVFSSPPPPPPHPTTDDRLSP